MITIAKAENISILPTNRLMLVELRGLSTDEKPEKIGNKIIENGSVFIEIDTGKVYMYDISSKSWKEV